MNVKVNKRLQEMDEVRVANFMPSSGDEVCRLVRVINIILKTWACFVSPYIIYLGQRIPIKR